MARRALGLVLAGALAIGLWYAWANYGQFANVARWTGDTELRWLRPWLTEFRTPLLCIAGALALSFLSWVWAKLNLGH